MSMDEAFQQIDFTIEWPADTFVGKVPNPHLGICISFL